MSRDEPEWVSLVLEAYTKPNQTKPSLTTCNVQRVESQVLVTSRQMWAPEHKHTTGSRAGPFYWTWSLRGSRSGSCSPCSHRRGVGCPKLKKTCRQSEPFSQDEGTGDGSHKHLGRPIGFDLEHTGVVAVPFVCIGGGWGTGVE